MGKKTPFIIVAVVGVIAASGLAIWYASSNNANQNDSQLPVTQDSGQNTAQATQPNTIDGFLNAGKNQKCTIKTTSGDANITGTMYFTSGKKMSAEYKSITADKTTTGNMIITENVQYFWTPSSNQGIKIDLSEASSSSNPSDSSAGSGLDTKKEYDFDCQSWAVDSSQFTPPTNVTFMDFTDIQSRLPQ